MASQTDSSEEPAPSEEVMAPIASCHSAIALCQTTLTSKIEAVQLDVGCIQQGIDKVHSHLTNAEGQMGQVEDTLGEHDGHSYSIDSTHLPANSGLEAIRSSYFFLFWPFLGIPPFIYPALSPLLVFRGLRSLFWAPPRLQRESGYRCCMDLLKFCAPGLV